MKPENAICTQVYQHWDAKDARLVRHMVGQFQLPYALVDYSRPIQISLEMYSDGRITAVLTQDGFKHLVAVDAKHVKYLYDEDMPL